MVDNKFQILILFLILFLGINQTLKLDSENPYYLNYKGNPLLLVTSAEPYGAVVNRDFDYKLYLKTLHDEGMNYTRIFSSSYIEVPGSFNVSHESLNPKRGSFLGPWKRVSEPGLFQGEGKFDFDQWNPNYFKRLHDFVKTAATYDIIVEFAFFCATYEDGYWLINPFDDQNNINKLAPSKRLKFNTLKNSKVVEHQKKLIEKVAQELNGFYNVFYEINNEPWSDYQEKTTYLHKTLIPDKKQQAALWARTALKETLAWQEELALVFRNNEKNLPKKDLLAQNYADMFESLTEVESNIDIMNIHYAWPEVVTVNYGWNRPINFDEPGFAGTANSTYLKQAWSFMINGSAIFNNPNYSFYVGREDGTGINRALDEGSKNLRRQLKFLHQFLKSFNFVEMKPPRYLVTLATRLEYYCLAQIGEEYALYFAGRNQGYALSQLPVGNYGAKVARYGKRLIEVI